MLEPTWGLWRKGLQTNHKAIVTVSHLQSLLEGHNQSVKQENLTITPLRKNIDQVLEAH